MERAVAAVGHDRRRDRRRADQSRLRRRAARADDGGPAGPRATSATRATPRPTASFTNAALVLARDLLKLDGLFAERTHPVLGRTTATPTMLEAGVSRNVTPPVAKAVLDIRSTPDWTHDELADVLRQALDVEGRRHLAAAGALRDAGRLAPAGRGSPLRPEARDLRQPDLLRLGVPPRHATRSSAGRAPAGGRTPPDEYVDLPEVTAARGFYARAGAGVSGRGQRRDAEGGDALVAGHHPDRGHVRLHRGRRPAWDARLLRWDVLGSLGHIEGLRASRLLIAAEYARLRAGLRAALARGGRGPLRGLAARRRTCTPRSRPGSPAGCPAIGERLHTGRSRNDQVATDSGSSSRTRCSTLHAARARAGGRAARVRAAGIARCSGRDTPTSGGRCRRRSGSGPGPTPRACSTRSSRSRRSGRGSTGRRWAARPATVCRCRSSGEAAARALGFAGLDHNVATRAGRARQARGGGAVLGTQLGHELARLSQDVILFSAEEYGYLVLPAELATGSSIMPHKRNPDLFELTRARAAALEGDLVAPAADQGQAGGRLPARFPAAEGAAHARARPHRGDAGGDGARGAEARRGSRALRRGAGRRRAGDRRGDAARGGRPAVPYGVRRGGLGAARRRALRRRRPPPRSSPAARSTGGLGNLGLATARARVRRARAWNLRERRRFDARHVPPRRPPLRPLARPPARPRDDRRPPQASPQDPRADQHAGGADPGGARGGAGDRGLGGDAVVGEPGHRGAAPDQGGRRLPPPARPCGLPRTRTSAGSRTAC